LNFKASELFGEHS